MNEFNKNLIILLNLVENFQIRNKKFQKYHEKVSQHDGESGVGQTFCRAAPCSTTFPTSLLSPKSVNALQKYRPSSYEDEGDKQS
jgi:hypothetical protein